MGPLHEAEELSKERGGREGGATVVGKLEEYRQTHDSNMEHESATLGASLQGIQDKKVPHVH